jgi:hypothetical protein
MRTKGETTADLRRFRDLISYPGATLCKAGDSNAKPLRKIDSDTSSQRPWSSSIDRIHPFQLRRVAHRLGSPPDLVLLGEKEIT